MLSHLRLSFPPSLKLTRLSIAELQRCWCGYVTWPCDLDLWPFNRGQWPNTAGHVVNPSTKFEDRTPIRSWLMSSDVGHRPPLTMRLEPLRMRRITRPVHRGKFFPNIWNPWPRFVYSLCNPHGSTIKVNWVICQNSVRPCVKRRTRCLRMRQITWPVSRGSKIITFLESPTPICLFTIQLLWSYDDD